MKLLINFIIMLTEGGWRIIQSIAVGLWNNPSILMVIGLALAISQIKRKLKK